MLLVVKHKIPGDVQPVDTRISGHITKEYVKCAYVLFTYIFSHLFMLEVQSPDQLTIMMMNVDA